MQDRRLPTKVPKKPFKSAVIQAGIITVACACALVASVFAQGGETWCPNLNVVVYTARSSDIGLVCDAAAKAVSFLTENGLDTSRAVKVHLVNELPGEAGSSSYGCYDHPHRRVFMLTYSACLTRGPWAGIPMDRELYKSLLAHEVAHAVAAANFSIAKPSLLAHEYVAYVTMFATMTPDQRRRLLKQFPGQGFDSVEQMSTTYYLMDPLRFGAESYRHFLKQDDGKAFLEDILAGEIRIGKDGR